MKAAGAYNASAAARSCHPGGVQIALCDGSVCWIGDYINIIGPVPYISGTLWPSGSVWDRLITSDDGLTLSANDF